MTPTGDNRTTVQHRLLQTFWAAAGGDDEATAAVHFVGTGELPGAFELTSFAAASVAAAGLALASLCRALGQGGPGLPAVQVDRRLAALWFDGSLSAQGWTLPPAWDAVAGNYACADGWIRLHTNAPHHRRAALQALQLLQADVDRSAVARAVAPWRADDLEAAIVANAGCAATLRSWPQWQQHLQGRAVLAEPLLHWQPGAPVPRNDWAATAGRPLQGLRVLDMTRVIAGPVATRLLAALGADVLRIDPPGWDESAQVLEMTPGKRCARLDLRGAGDRACWNALLQGADVLVHGYRSDALQAMGAGTAWRQQQRPGLVDVSLDAYGFTGPWAGRRGFDSLVQMSMGVADAGRPTAADGPVPLPVQALDHATGYLLATAVLRGLETRLRNGRGSIARASLARTGAELMGVPRSVAAHALPPLAPAAEDDWQPGIEVTTGGPVRRLRWPLQVAGVQTAWRRPAVALGSDAAAWS